MYICTYIYIYTLETHLLSKHLHHSMHKKGGLEREPSPFWTRYIHIYMYIYIYICMTYIYIYIYMYIYIYICILYIHHWTRYIYVLLINTYWTRGYIYIYTYISSMYICNTYWTRYIYTLFIIAHFLPS